MELELAREREVAARSSSDPSEVPTGPQADSTDEKTDNEAPSARRPGIPGSVLCIRVLLVLMREARRRECVHPVHHNLAPILSLLFTLCQVPSLTLLPFPQPPKRLKTPGADLRARSHDARWCLISPAPSQTPFPQSPPVRSSPLPGLHANIRVEARCNGVHISAEVYVPPENQTPTRYGAMGRR